MEDLLTNLPREIIIDILSRLPIPTIMSCKCVCKSWHDLVESPEFANSHLSKSVPGLVAQHLYTGHRCKVFEFNPRCNVSFSFCLPHPLIVNSSLDGLLFLIKAFDSIKRHLYICNPITREYITLPLHPSSPRYWGIYGFGMSKITRQYKLAMIAPPGCEVYALRTGCWRSIPASRLHLYTTIKSNQTGMFLNGNLHWLASDDCNDANLHIGCLDLETELFSPQFGYAYKSLTAWGDRLYFLGSYSSAVEIVIWSMKAYGDEKSWTRELVIKQQCRLNFCPIKVFKDGDFLLAVGYGDELVCFSTKTNTIRTINLPGLFVDFSTFTFTYTPSFLPVLKSLAKENVKSF